MPLDDRDACGRSVGVAETSTPQNYERASSKKDIRTDILVVPLLHALRRSLNGDACEGNRVLACTDTHSITVARSDARVNRIYGNASISTLLRRYHADIAWEKQPQGSLFVTRN
jgi:hypothetical protein